LKKSRTIHYDPFSIYLLSTSLVGLCLTALAVSMFQNTNSYADSPWRRLVIGSLFGLICILGITAAFYPSKCSQEFHFKATRKRVTIEEKLRKVTDETLRLRGHHPDCGRFSTHVLQINGEVFCAGCLGLAVGAMISLGGTILYFFAGLPISISSGLVVFWAGFVGVALGLLQYHLFDFGNGVFHMVLNVLFVVGAFLLLVGIDALMGSLLAAFYLLALDVFWIFTRIELSRRNHRAVCENCGLEACPLRRGGWI